jgi:hypothetical protein
MENDQADCMHTLGKINEYPQGWVCVKQFFREGPKNMPEDWRDCE